MIVLASLGLIIKFYSIQNQSEAVLYKAIIPLLGKYIGRSRLDIPCGSILDKKLVFLFGTQ